MVGCVEGDELFFVSSVVGVRFHGESSEGLVDFGFGGRVGESEREEAAWRAGSLHRCSRVLNEFAKQVEGDHLVDDAHADVIAGTGAGDGVDDLAVDGYIRCEVQCDSHHRPDGNGVGDRESTTSRGEIAEPRGDFEYLILNLVSKRTFAIDLISTVRSFVDFAHEASPLGGCHGGGMLENSTLQLRGLAVEWCPDWLSSHVLDPSI